MEALEEDVVGARKGEAFLIVVTAPRVSNAPY